MTAKLYQRRIDARVRRRRLYELGAVVAVLDGGLRRPVLVEHLLHLEPRVGRRHGPGLQDARKRIEVEPLRPREVHGLGQARGQRDEEEVDGVLCLEPHAHGAASDGRARDGLDDGPHPLRGGLVAAGHHAHQRAPFRGHPAAADGHLDELAARTGDRGRETPAKVHRDGAGVDQGLAGQRLVKRLVHDGVKGVLVEQHGEDDVGLLYYLHRGLGNGAACLSEGYVFC